MEAELAKLEFNLGGVRDMQRVPDAVVVIDLSNEEIAVAEASRLGIPIIGLVDTNCNPRPVDFVIPGNDDAIRSCELIIRTLGESILTSASAWQAAEDARRKREEEERKRREAEERKRREEEAARKAEAEAKAKADAGQRRPRRPKAGHAQAPAPQGSAGEGPADGAQAGREAGSGRRSRQAAPPAAAEPERGARGGAAEERRARRRREK